MVLLTMTFTLEGGLTRLGPSDSSHTFLFKAKWVIFPFPAFLTAQLSWIKLFSLLACFFVLFTSSVDPSCYKLLPWCFLIRMLDSPLVVYCEMVVTPGLQL